MSFYVQEKIEVRVQYCVDFLNEFSCRLFIVFGRFLKCKINGRFSCTQSLFGF